MAVQKRQYYSWRVVYKFFLIPLFLPAFLLDLILYMATNKDECVNCGWGDIVKKGVFCQVLVKVLKND